MLFPVSPAAVRFSNLFPCYIDPFSKDVPERECPNALGSSWATACHCILLATKLSAVVVAFCNWIVRLMAMSLDRFPMLLLFFASSNWSTTGARHLQRRMSPCSYMVIRKYRKIAGSYGRLGSFARLEQLERCL